MGRGGGNEGRIACILCLVVVFCVLLALLGFIGLCLAIWQIVDALHTNAELMNIARLAVPDPSLLNAIYVFIAFTAFSACFGGVGGKSKKSDGDDSQNATSCCGLIMSLILVSGYLASGILSAKYQSETLPKMEEGMTNLLLNRSYLNPDMPISAPDYTSVGKRFNYLQAKHKCCGVSLPNGGDYVHARFAQRYNLTVPYSCCVLKENDVSLRETTLEDVENYGECSKFNPDYFHTKTCYETEHKFLNFKCNFLMGYNFTLVCAGICIMVLLGCMVACLRCCT